MLNSMITFIHIAILGHLPPFLMELLQNPPMSEDKIREYRPESTPSQCSDFSISTAGFGDQECPVRSPSSEFLTYTNHRDEKAVTYSFLLRSLTDASLLVNVFVYILLLISLGIHSILSNIFQKNSSGACCLQLYLRSLNSPIKVASPEVYKQIV